MHQLPDLRTCSFVEWWGKAPLLIHLVIVPEF